MLSPSIYLVEASSGLEAIYFFELLNKAKCQILLILLDINMGPKEIDGYETAFRIRDHEKQIMSANPLIDPVTIIVHSGDDAKTMR